MLLVISSASNVSNSALAPAIYKKNMNPVAIQLGLVVVIAVVITSLAGAQMAVLMGISIFVGLGVPWLIESRRTLILSPESFEYRWGFGSVVSGGIEVVEVADISRVEEVPTIHMPMGRPVKVPGLKLVLRSGEEKVFPIDFPARQELVARLRAMVEPN